MEQYINDLLAWINENSEWAVLIVFLIAFLESLAIVGLAVPGWLLLVGIGSLIGAGHLNFWWISLASFAGAALGQIISFGVGHYFSDKVHHWRWIKKHQSMMDNAEVFFKKHGFIGILIGQFIGPIRAVISLVAGILEMPWKRFVSAVIIASMIWAPLYLMPGVLVGATLTFDKQHMWILIGLVAIFVVASWLILSFLIDKYKKQISISAKRKVITTIACIALITAIIFVVNSNFGSLLLDLLGKIWEVIS